LDSTPSPTNACATGATLTTANSTGILSSGYSYFVTYITESDAYSPGVSYGYPQGLPCQYIQRIEAAEDASGNPQYLRAFFNTSFFPYLRTSAGYLRTSAGLDSFSGTGWNANRVQLLVNKVSLTDYPSVDLDTIPTDTWRRISTGAGNGIYSGASGTNTIWLVSSLLFH
jgi:hypothetical protein